MAKLSFDARWGTQKLPDGVSLPAWVTGIRQEGGVSFDQPRSWQVAAGTPQGTGKLEISIARSRINSRILVATLFFDAEENTDFSVQLFVPRVMWW